MEKSLLYRLFRIGRFPARHMPALEAEGIVLQDEGIGGSITYRNVSGAGRYYSWKRSWFTGSLVLTQYHFVAFAWTKQLLYISLDNEDLARIQFSLEKPNLFSIRSSAAMANEAWSGEIVCRYRTAQAALFVEQLRHYTS